MTANNNFSISLPSDEDHTTDGYEVYWEDFRQGEYWGLTSTLVAVKKKSEGLVFQWYAPTGSAATFFTLKRIEWL
jgi:hypothetical protein